MEGHNETIERRTIVELDLVGYSDIARYLEEHLGAKAVMQLNKQIQGFVDEGLLSVNIPRSEAVNSKAGDNAIVVFERVTDAHRFAEAFHRLTEQYNTGKREVSAERHFRLGISTGNIAIDGDEIAGTTIIDSCRLEAGGDKGHILISADTFNELPTDFRSSYVGPEILKDKRGKEHQVYRYIVVERERGSDQCRHGGYFKNKKSYAVAAYSVLAVILLAGLFFLTEPLRRTSAVKASASAFLNGIKSGDYKDSYSRLSRTSRQSYQLKDFVGDHSGTRPKIKDFTIVRTTFKKTDSNKAFANVSSSANLYGRRTLNLELNKEEGEWRIVFSRNIVLPPTSANRGKNGGGFSDFINSLFK